MWELREKDNNNIEESMIILFYVKNLYGGQDDLKIILNINSILLYL